MNSQKRSMGIAALALAAVLLTPLIGCHEHRRDSRSTRYRNQQHSERQQLAAEQRRLDEEHRRLDEQRRRERERRDWRRNY